MVYLNISDSVSSARAKVLIGKAVQFSRFVAPFRAARANPGIALCSCCWCWGHPATACHGLQGKCPICSGPHHKEHHCALASCCQGNSNVSPLIPATAEGAPGLHLACCINCHKEHVVDDRHCNFWHHCFDLEWIKVCYDEVSECKCSCSPLLTVLQQVEAERK